MPRRDTGGAAGGPAGPRRTSAVPGAGGVRLQQRPAAPRSTGPALNVPHGTETTTVGRQQAGAAEAVPCSEGDTSAQMFCSLHGMLDLSLLPTTSLQIFAIAVTSRYHKVFLSS